MTTLISPATGGTGTPASEQTWFAQAAGHRPCYDRLLYFHWRVWHAFAEGPVLPNNGAGRAPGPYHGENRQRPHSLLADLRCGPAARPAAVQLVCGLFHRHCGAGAHRAHSAAGQQPAASALRERHLPAEHRHRAYRAGAVFGRVLHRKPEAWLHGRKRGHSPAGQTNLAKRRFWPLPCSARATCCL